MTIVNRMVKHRSSLAFPNASIMSLHLPNVVPAVALSGELGFLHTRLGRRMIPAFISPNAVSALQDQWDTTAHDILICTHQKVGTHLTKKFIVEILRHAGALQADHPAADGDIGKGAVPWPEVTASQGGIDAFLEFLERTKGHPRVFYTHANIDELPVRCLHPKTRLIMTYRDPKGAAVSQFHFYKQHPTLGVSCDLTLDQFVGLFLKGDLYFGDYHQHVKGYFNAASNGIAREQLCILRYEDLVENKHVAIQRLEQALFGQPVLTTDQRDRVAASTEFNTMKQSILKNPGTFHFNAERFFRSGRTDDWKQQLSLLQMSAIDRKTRRTWGHLSAPLVDRTASNTRFKNATFAA